MPSSLPYLNSPGAISNCLIRIKAAATPQKVTPDFVQTTLQIKGGTGKAIIPFLKKIGLVSSDGTPTDLYKKYRNQSTGNTAIADAIKFGYKALLENNEYFYELSDTELKDCIVNVTGLDFENSVFKQTFATLKNLISFASFDQSGENEQKYISTDTSISLMENLPENNIKPHETVGLNLAYTINLNLPATTDQAVFNAIFKSLKEHLLSNGK
jgi:hypothetical protein